MPIQSGRCTVQKPRSNNHGLGETIGAELYGIFEANSEFRAIAKQALEEREIQWCRDDENLANSRKHQNRQRIVNH